MNSSLQQEISGFRKFFDGLGNAYPPSPHVTITPEIIARVNCYWFAAPNTNRNKIIVYLHGGSYAAGSVTSHKPLVSHLAALTNLSIVLIEYALAPENPYPQGVQDAFEVYRSLRAQYPASDFILMGDSAGGGLALSLLGQLQKESLALPKGVVMISPWLDLRSENESYKTNAAKDPILNQPNMKKYAQWYAPDHADANPANITLQSPPPFLILTGENEVLLDDSIHFYAAIKSRQANAHLKIFKDVNHVWILTDITSDAAKNALSEIGSFLASI